MEVIFQLIITRIPSAHLILPESRYSRDPLCDLYLLCQHWALYVIYSEENTDNMALFICNIEPYLYLQNPHPPLHLQNISVQPLHTSQTGFIVFSSYAVSRTPICPVVVSTGLTQILCTWWPKIELYNNDFPFTHYT